MEQGYVNGKPLHIADPAKSRFDTISHAQFEALTGQELQARLRQKNLVVTGCPHPNLKFDEAGLRTLTALDSQISIQGELLNFLNASCSYQLTIRSLRPR
jgi:hypothetical protein